MKFTRSTAHKLWIGDLLGGTFTKGEGEFDPSYLSIRGNQVSRVNIVGIIVDKGDTDNMMSFSLDDGSANISLRIWGDDRSIAEGINVGDVVLVLGRIRVYNEVRHVLIEVIGPIFLSNSQFSIILFFVFRKGFLKRTNSRKDLLNILF